MTDQTETAPSPGDVDDAAKREQPATAVSALSMIDASGTAWVKIALDTGGVVEDRDDVGEHVEVLLSVDQAIAHSSYVMEAACVAELEAAMFRWLLKDEAGAAGEPDEVIRANAAKIVAAFRKFRSEPNYAIGGTDAQADPD